MEAENTAKRKSEDKNVLRISIFRMKILVLKTKDFHFMEVTFISFIRNPDKFNRAIYRASWRAWIWPHTIQWVIWRMWFHCQPLPKLSSIELPGHCGKSYITRAKFSQERGMMGGGEAAGGMDLAAMAYSISYPPFSLPPLSSLSFALAKVLAQAWRGTTVGQVDDTGIRGYKSPFHAEASQSLPLPKKNWI